MTRLFLIALLGGGAWGVPEGSADPAEGGVFTLVLTDSLGWESRLVGVRRVDGTPRFQGWRGSAEILVPYGRIASMSLVRPARPGERWGARIALRTGAAVEATFDEREGDTLLSGFSALGQVRFSFRDSRRIVFEGETREEELPVFGPPDRGVDARVIDREGVETELVGLHRATGENVLVGRRGATFVDVPLRILASVTLERGLLRLRLVSGATSDLSIPATERGTVFCGEAEFGDWRILFGDVRAIRVHRVTPVLRDLDPVAALEGEAREEGGSTR
jgi:hypothetical protein